MVGFADCMGSIYKQLTYMRHLRLDTATYERLQGSDKASRFESRLASVGPLNIADSVMDALQRRNALDDRLHAWARSQKSGTRFAHEGCRQTGPVQRLARLASFQLALSQLL